MIFNTAGPGSLPTPEWSKVRYDEPERLKLLAEIGEIGLTTRFVAGVCRVETSIVEQWTRTGILPQKKREASMSNLDALGGLLRHMRIDLVLANDEILEFMNEPTRPPAEQGENDEQSLLVLSHLGNMGLRGATAIEERLAQRFPDQYEFFRSKPAASNSK